MKIRILLFLLISVFTFQSATASHGMGGEITWKCLANGKFIFKLKFYRDCNGIPGPSGPINLDVCGHPTVSSIPLTLTSQNDISSTGCTDCALGGPGTVEEYIYESAPITMAGIPPPTGWFFTWGTCCRSGTISNLANPASSGFGFTAIMYPYNMQNTNPAYDSSPEFLHKPDAKFCIGVPVIYSSAAHDPDSDSLVYTWNSQIYGGPCDYSTGGLIFAPGYSFDSPLPGTFHHPMNVPASLNPQTGLISFTSFTSGYFITSVKVESYKCGQLVSMVSREINIVLTGNCDTLQNGANNNSPIMTAPFADTSGQLTLYTDTIMVGDTVQFTIQAYDFDIDALGNLQTVLLDGHSTIFPDSSYIPGTICASPPCAAISSNLPVGPTPSAITFQVNWISDCDHLIGSTTCVVSNRQIDMEFNVVDNNCEAPAVKSRMISVIVKDYATVKAPKIALVNTLGNGDSELFWTPSPDPDSTFLCYYIYYANSSNGPWILLDSTSNINQNTYIHVGAMGNTTSLFYQLAAKSSNICQALHISDPSITVGNLYSSVPNGLEAYPITIYPNPASEILYIDSELFLKQEISIEIQNLLGQLIETIVSQKNELQSVNIKNYESGVYVISIIADNNKPLQKRFVKQ